MPFQTYDAPKTRDLGDTRLAELRASMGDLDLDAVFVPHADEQRNEYLPANTQRLAWISGFTGSAGAALILRNEAVLFVDGRYTLQAAQQVDAEHWSIESLVDMPPHEWLAKRDDRPTVGVDPWLVSAAEARRLRKVADLVFLDPNPIDAIWKDRPVAPRGAVRIHPFEFAGQLTADKLSQMDASLADAGADIAVLSDASSVSWLFNIRGADVAHTPLVLAHAILRLDGEPLLFVDPSKLDRKVRAFLTQVAAIHELSELVSQLELLAENRTVGLDDATSPYALHQTVEAAGGTVVAFDDPVVLARAVKNDAEIAGARAAHLRDGLAMVAFLAWLDEQPPGTISEIEAARRLEAFRGQGTDMPLLDVSFDTISGSGPNGAIVHYRVTEATDRTLEDGELYLVDSGGQYADGTTDVTRTVAIGEPASEHRRCFTLVLKGHIAIARARFPEGTRGVDLDVLARAALWRAGLDYAHGTGHGVGSALSVHEGPQGLSRRAMAPFKPGMIVSNEPGYYRTNAFGIRIENLLLVHEARDIPGGDTPMLGFENLTLAPLDRRLIDTSMLEPDELDWIDAYHATVLETLGSSTSHTDWLEHACAPLNR